jgi:hypothetical protein
MAAVKAVRPNIRFHFLEALWYGTEARPDGSGPDDAAVQATNAAERTAVLAEPQAEWFPIRKRIYEVDSPAYNPTNLTLGAMTQDGYHPTITAGQQAISNEVYALTSFGM